MSNFWQGKSIRLRAVELEDWKYFLVWDKDIEFSQFTDDLLFPDSPERLKKWFLNWQQLSRGNMISV